MLIQAVLTSLHVYWFALVPLPKSILNKLRKLIFSLLWGSRGDSNRFHLMDWKSLSKPLEFSGWGINDLDWFSASLRLKSLWMVLNGNGLWSHVIIAKYLKNQSLDRWLRSKLFIVRGPSVICNGFLHTLSWLGRFMGW